MSKIITIISKKIPWKVPNIDDFNKFYYFNNDKRKIIFGLLSLVNTQERRIKFTRRNELVGLISVGVTGGITLLYLENKFMKNNISHSSVTKGSTNVLSASYNGLKNPVANLFSKSKPEQETSKGFRDYIPSFSSSFKRIKEGSTNVLSASYNGIKNPVANLFSKSKPDQETSKGFRDYIPSFSSSFKSIKEGSTNVLSASYNGIKNPVANLFSKSEPEKEASKGFRDYIPSFSSSLKNVKEGTANVLSASYNSIKYSTLTLSIFSGRKPEKQERDVGNDQLGVNINQNPDLEEGEKSGISFSTIVQYCSKEINKVGLILQEFNKNHSNEEKCKLLIRWLSEINSIYYIMQNLNTNTSRNILSQYSKQSKKFNDFITRSISKEEDYSRIVSILACATVISVQLLLIAYLNVPFTDQLANIAFSVFTNLHSLKNDPKVKEILDQTIKKVQTYVPVDLNKLQNVNLQYYMQMINMAYAFFTSINYKDK